MNKKLISVGIVDDHTLFREGLVNLLREYDNITVIFEAKNGLDLQDKLKRFDAPDIVLLDINMPVMDGHETAIWLKANFPLIHMLALSMYEDDINIIKMLRKGAGGYILKECHAGELVRAITMVIDDGYYINELVSGKLLCSVRDEPIKNSKDQDIILSAREMEFLQLCCSELTYKEIADQMNVSPRTIDGYRDSLFEKLQLKSRTGLVLYGIKNNLVTID